MFVRPDWHRDALCRGTMKDGSNDWWPEYDSYDKNYAARRRAEKVCARCPVRDECTQAAATERQGLWGGANLAVTLRRSSRQRRAS